MEISAKANYGNRAVTYLAVKKTSSFRSATSRPTKKIPVKFLEQILLELKRAGVVTSKRVIEAATAWPPTRRN